jgi:hypothetical protein
VGKIKLAKRLGRFVANENGTTRKPRPVLVKLRVVWDRRLILSKCSKLRQYGQRGIFIVPDNLLKLEGKTHSNVLNTVQSVRGSEL